MRNSLKVDVVKESKKLPLVATWGTKNIDLGEVVFLGDNSLVLNHDSSVVRTLVDQLALA